MLLLTICTRRAALLNLADGDSCESFESLCVSLISASTELTASSVGRLFDRALLECSFEWDFHDLGAAAMRRHLRSGRRHLSKDAATVIALAGPHAGRPEVLTIFDEGLLHGAVRQALLEKIALPAAGGRWNTSELHAFLLSLLLPRGRGAPGEALFAPTYLYNVLHGFGHGALWRAALPLSRDQQSVCHPPAAGSLQISDAQLAAALALCGALPSTDVAAVCAEGVFMSYAKLTNTSLPGQHWGTLLAKCRDRQVVPAHLAAPCYHRLLDFAAVSNASLAAAFECDGAAPALACIFGASANGFLAFDVDSLLATFYDDAAARAFFGSHPYHRPLERFWRGTGGGGAASLMGASGAALHRYAVPLLAPPPRPAAAPPTLVEFCGRFVAPEPPRLLSRAERARWMACVHGSVFAYSGVGFFALTTDVARAVVHGACAELVLAPLWQLDVAFRHEAAALCETTLLEKPRTLVTLGRFEWYHPLVLLDEEAS